MPSIAECRIILRKTKYIVETDDGTRLHPDVLKCGDFGVETEAADVRINMPELFVDEP